MSSSQRRKEVDKHVIERYLGTAIGREAFKGDAQFYADVQRLRQLLTATEEAMAAEGVDERARDRVLYRLLYGVEPESSYVPPDFREAHNRMIDRHAAMLQALSQPLTPPEWTL